jgi:hypothetical protein
MLAGYIKGTLYSELGLSKDVLVQQAPYECYAVGYAAGRRELREWMSWIRRTVTARLGDFHKTGAQSERRMVGEVGNGEYFVPQRRDEQQIHVGKDTRHFLGHAAAKAAGVNEVNRNRPFRVLEGTEA